jgi:hypothetical protein
MEIKCKFCAKKFNGVIDLSKHIKEHRISQKKYFEQFYPRHDLSNKKKIDFKSVEQYFLSDFTDKTSMKSWLASIGKEKALEYLSGKIKKYCEVKNLKHAPPEFFIQTISCLPSIRFIEKLSGVDYNNVCEKSKKISKYDYLNLDIRATNCKPAKQIVIDTREKRPLKFAKDLRKVNVALDYGDYALSPASRIVIERKSFSDFFGTFGANLERFEKELLRAENNNGYIIIMVEASYSSLAYNKKRWFATSPEYIFHRVRDLYKKYECFQIVFCDGRKHMTDLILKILGLGEEVKKIDLQYCIEKEII